MDFSKHLQCVDQSGTKGVKKGPRTRGCVSGGPEGENYCAWETAASNSSTALSTSGEMMSMR